jgi:hypothetical protein
LFRDPLITRGGAIPGLQAYGDALDKNPITMKALTSLVGWLLGDLLAQVSYSEFLYSLLQFDVRYLMCNESLSMRHLPLINTKSDLHRWRSRRLQASCHPLFLRIHLPRPLGTLLLQLARQASPRNRCHPRFHEGCHRSALLVSHLHERLLHLPRPRQRRFSLSHRK